MIRVAQAFVPNRGIAEEVVQETWVGMLRGLDRFEGRASLKTWLYAILINQARSIAGRERRTVPFDHTDDTRAEDPARFAPDGGWVQPPVPFTEEVEDRLFVALDRPDTCPHGFPIPAKETADMPLMPRLYALEPGDTAVVAVPGSTDPEIVAFLDTLGLRPGVRVEVKEKHPFDGPLVLRVNGKVRTLGATVANQVYVQKSA